MLIHIFKFLWKKRVRDHKGNSKRITAHGTTLRFLLCKICMKVHEKWCDHDGSLK